MTIVTIVFISMLSHSTVFGLPDLPNSIGFLGAADERVGCDLGGHVGPSMPRRY
jgi:hypothetical protein